MYEELGAYVRRYGVVEGKGERGPVLRRVVVFRSEGHHLALDLVLVPNHWLRLEEDGVVRKLGL